MVSVFMKAGRVQACIDYIKFNHEAEGFEFSEEEEQAIRGVLEGDANADELIQAYIDSHSLSTEYVPPQDELSFYPHTSSLVNYFSIKERAKLRRVEAYMANIRTAEMLTETVQNTYDFDYLKSIHERMLVMSSLGRNKSYYSCRRECSAIPSTRQCCGGYHSSEKDRYLVDMDRETFINDLAFYMGEVEALHPFRDGNGRTARLFFYQLSMNAGYDIDWSLVDADRLLEADISAIDGDYQLLIDVLEEVVI